jgi:hypothetical protein
MDKQYIIYNFINEYLEDFYDNGMPYLSLLHENCMVFNLKDAEEHLIKLHQLGFTGLQIKEYTKSLYD